MKRILALLALALFAVSARAADPLYYFGSWYSYSTHGYAYITERDNVLSVTLVRYDGAMVQTRRGAESPNGKRFRFVSSDGRRLVLAWNGSSPFHWTGHSQLIDGGQVARISAVQVFSPVWETLGYPANP